MASRKPPELLSYSFLDILACTVAAVLFVLMVLALQLADVSPEALPQAELFALQARRTELLKALDGASAADREREIVDLRAQLAPLESELQTTRRLAKRADAAARKRLKALRAKRKTSQLAIRPRATRATQKSPGVSFDVYRDRVDAVDVVAGKPSGSPPTVRMQLRVRESFKPRDVSGSGTINRLLDRLDPRRQYVFAFLRADAIPLFVQLRRLLVQRGFDVDWRPNPAPGREFTLQLPEDWETNTQAPRTD